MNDNKSKIKEPKIMGIVNATPDSFSNDGIIGDAKINEHAFLSKIEKMILDGVDIIDIGGESTKPNAILVSEKEEIKRVIPLIKIIRAKFKDIKISIDTYKSKVAEQALLAGADFINDVWGGKKDSAILDVAARNNVHICLMHNDSSLGEFEETKTGYSYKVKETNFFLKELLNDLNNLAKNALNKGIKKDKIILDPGIGFGKSVSQNLLILQNIEKIKKLGFPVLIGASRKSFIGEILGEKVNKRLEGTLAVSMMSMIKGANIIRVHDVKENKKVLKTISAILNAEDK